MTDPAIIEAAFEALQEETGYGMSDDNAREFSRIVLTAATPLIRAQVLKEAAFFDSDKYVRPVLDSATSLIRAAALEEAAQVADEWTGRAAYAIAKDIRTLKEQP